ncbi:helix-turn-helix domain-containing protein [Jatrophihabitans telluris]|uniref:Helix-turn-helix domain-containing protein n=1 Tax=Jatrophihabitans telluris TaxID=2038343 RepID=A0ABY4R0V0_9ACTN|nr:helix-turn-helix domain-containing protein [Jatrophihabitans telluris]UQX89147.1 helix-turn-helix domain-containing protein [Jatrophihabitans telluris]
MNGDELISVAQAARESGWDENVLRIWVGSGLLPSVTATNGRKQLRRSDVRNFAPPPTPLSVGQAAAILGVDEQEIRYQVRKGVIPVRRSTGGHYRIDPEVLSRISVPPRRRRASPGTR